MKDLFRVHVVGPPEPPGLLGEAVIMPTPERTSAPPSKSTALSERGWIGIIPHSA